MTQTMPTPRASTPHTSTHTLARPSRTLAWWSCTLAPLFVGGDDETAGGDDEAAGGDTLDDAARDSGEHVRRRLRDELGREPTDAEIDEWLRDHTESY